MLLPAFMLAGILMADTAVFSPAQQHMPPARLWKVLSGADSAALFRVRSRTGNEMSGRLGRLDSAQVTLGEGPAVPLADIDVLWRRGTAWRTGAVIGAGALGVGGAFLGSLAYGMNDENPIVGGVVGGLSGAAVGCLLGAGVGSFFHKWQRKYP